MEHAFIKQSFRGKYNFMTRKMLAAIKKNKLDFALIMALLRKRYSK